MEKERAETAEGGERRGELAGEGVRAEAELGEIGEGEEGRGGELPGEVEAGEAELRHVAAGGGARDAAPGAGGVWEGWVP